jgi:large subunit ribosomal protein L28
MSRVCQITGKKVMVGNNVSHSKRRTRRKFYPNLFDKRFYLEDEDRWVKLRVSASGIRTINKKGLKNALEEAKEKGFLKSY